MFFSYLLLFIAGIVAGAINAVAGGGSLISFPALVLCGVPIIPANATNAAALWPGSLASVWGYRKETQGALTITLLMTIPAIVGAWVGAWALLHTPEELFRRAVPLLVLIATLLLWLQPKLKKQAEKSAHTHHNRYLSAILLQIPVSIYGGYFGAGMGIMMLAVLGFSVEGNIHRLNAIKTWLATIINIVATLYFATANSILIGPGVVLGIGAIVGGYLGAQLALKFKPDQIRYFVIAIGLILTAIFAWKS